MTTDDKLWEQARTNVLARGVVAIEYYSEVKKECAKLQLKEESTMTTEQNLYRLISILNRELTDMHPKDGLSSPRDINLIAEINKKAAILDKLQEAMRIINPEFHYQPLEGIK